MAGTVDLGWVGGGGGDVRFGIMYKYLVCIVKILDFE